MSSTEPNFKAFGKILAFMNALNDAFSTDFPEVKKYYSLVKCTKLDNNSVINKQNKIFEDYCMKNFDAIKSNNLENLVSDDIVYNDKIKFNLKSIVAGADKNSQDVICKHLQVILCLFHPDEDIKSSLAAAKSESKEDDIFNSIIASVEQQYSNTSDILSFDQALSDVKSNGLYDNALNKISQGVATGELDMEKLMNSAFGMISKIKEEANDPQINGIVNMVEMMMKSAKSSM